MANIRALAKRLLGGRGAAEGRPRLAGWVRVDSDNVVRGWAWDPADPGRRLTVRILVDSKPIAEALADRFDSKLTEHGDGRHGFAVVVPQALRDGREHAFEAVVEEAGYRLMSKARTFVIEAQATAPRLHLVEVTPTGLRARMRGGQYAKDTPLELWSGGRRLDPQQLAAGRRGDGPQAELTLAYPREVFLGLGADAVVAAPGMVEAGSGSTPLFAGVRLRAEPRDGGLALWLDGPLWLDGATALVRVLDEEGALMASGEAALGPDPVTLALPAGMAVEGARVEAVVEGRSIPGLAARVGDPAPAEAASANLIRNAELTDWPNGVLVRGGPARFELARGWHARNVRSPASLRAMAFPLDQEGEACSLTLAAHEVGDYCRLDAEVESRAALGGRRLTLAFEAGVAHGPLEAFRAPDDFAQIERVFLAPAGGKAGEGITIARAVLLTREMRRFEFGFEAPDDLAGGAFVLAFDFKRPFAITLQRPSLAFASASEAVAAPLAFEDPAVEAQAALLAGFEDWLSSRVVVPSVAPPLDGPAPRWGEPWPQGSVEVVICMHDAASETLDCLRSLVRGSAIPHRVRIVDDASGEDGRRRIEAFIADKPWMRLDPNPAHLGYTASANRGIRASTADWVILLNSDTVVSEGWIEGLLEAAASDAGVGMVGPLSNAASFQSVPEVVDAAGKLAVNQLPPGWTVERMAQLVRERSERAFPSLPLLNGFCALIRREAFDQVGGFDEAAFPMGYGEENDLCLRMAAAGWTLVVADQTYVHHVKSASFGAERRAALQAEGTAALKRLHPGLDLAALTAGMLQTPALVRMRAEVRAAWDGG